MHCYQKFLLYHVKYKCSKFLAKKHHKTRNNNSLGLAQQLRLRDNFWAIGTLVLAFHQLFYLLIWEFIGFNLSLHQLNLGVSDISANIDTGFLQPDDVPFSTGRKCFEGRKCHVLKHCLS